jgi:indolepyruvate ferredoxin oxidoreductase beta subunit
MNCENIIIAGIGGQGTVLASRLIAAAAMESGQFVRTAETIGMAQRGGSVTSHVRINSEDVASMIPYGSADLLIAFDATEALRASVYLKKGGRALINLPDGKTLPDGIDFETVTVDAEKIAIECGSAKALNVALIGVASANSMLPFDVNFMRGIIEKNVPAKFAKLNLACFDAGSKHVK